MSKEPRKRILQAVGGVAAFVGFGLVFMPGFAKHEPEPASDGQPPRVQRGASTSAAPAAPAAIDLDQFAADVPASATPNAGGGFDCMIVPNEVVAVGSAITGVVEMVAVDRGDYVDVGQVVARLEDSVERAALRVAEARAARTDAIESSRTNLALSRKRLARAEELFERDVLSLDTRQEIQANADLAALELERAEEDHHVAQLQLEQARANLERRTIRTPVAGVVVDRLLSAGEVVDDETIVQIAQVDPLRVEAILPGARFGSVRSGDTARVVPEAPLDAPREAAVAVVDPVLDGASGTFGVRLDLPNPDRALPAGLRCRVSFLERSPEAPLAEAADTPIPDPPELSGVPIPSSPAREPARPSAPNSIGALRWQPLPATAIARVAEANVASTPPPAAPSPSAAIPPPEAVDEPEPTRLPAPPSVGAGLWQRLPSAGD